MRDKAEGLRSRKSAAAKAFNQVIIAESAKTRSESQKIRDTMVRRVQSQLDIIKECEAALEALQLESAAAAATEREAGAIAALRVARIL